MPQSPTEATSDGPKPIAAALSQTMQRILSRPVVSEDESQAREKRRIAEFRNEQWKRLVRSIGERYGGCQLGNFETGGDKRKQEAIDRLLLLCKNMPEHVESGGNVILYGPPGTGKDHLLMALMHRAIGCGFSVDWHNGQDLFGDFRDRIDGNRSEDSSIRSYESPAVLAISDPVPPKGSAGDYTTTMLYRIIDRRYRSLRSTWITANIAKADEARAELSGPIFDRLMDNCVTVFCNWPSYRQARKPAWMK